MRYPDHYKGRGFTKVKMGFNSILGVPSGAVSSELLSQLRECYERNFPDFEDSSVRKLFEGRLEGVPSVLSTIPASKRNTLNQTILLLELMDTFVKEKEKKDEPVEKPRRSGKPSARRDPKLSADSKKSSAGKRKPGGTHGSAGSG
jgi:hypothetical protein